jgi:hypothetical protein
MNKYKSIFALLLYTSSIALAWVWFSWQLPVVLFLFQWASNIEQRNK